MPSPSCSIKRFSASVVILACGIRLEASIPVSLTSSIPSPAPLGTVVTWSTQVDGSDSRTLWYRFRSRQVGGAFRTIVDYGPNHSLDWTEMDHEGTYQIEVSIQDKSSGETATAVAVFELTSRITSAGTAAVSTTKNPLVFLYSAPSCAAGGRMRVNFQGPEGTIQMTPYQACHSPTSMNFYLAGLRASSLYMAWHTLDNGSTIVQSPKLAVNTPLITIAAPNYKVYQPPSTAASQTGVLLQFALYVPVIATDLSGNVIWYYDQPVTGTRAEGNGMFMGFHEDTTTADAASQYVRKFDVAGITLAETNAARVSEQLIAMGRRPINAFHHEARAIAGGRYLVLADNEQILTNVQGHGDVDVIGDEILVLDSNLQVDWAWDAFDHLDTSRTATLGETCPSGAGCAPYHLAPTANDWLHGNSLQLTPDGQILYSARHQDRIFKINYDSGLGDGSLLWILGRDGDFQIISEDPSPLFSHQHDANYVQTSVGYRLMVFDDGNLRSYDDPNAHSRGQVYQLDEDSRTATLRINADLGGYSFALGAAEILPNGNYHFDAGWISDDPVGGMNASRSVEVDKSGNAVYGLSIGTPEYRTYRLRDLYTAPAP